MKRLLLFACFGLLLLIDINAQDLDFKVKADSSIIQGNKTYSLTIEIIKGNGPYCIYLCDKEPWLGGNILDEIMNIPSSKYIIKDLTIINNRLVLVKGIGKDEYNWKPVSVRNKK